MAKRVSTLPFTRLKYFYSAGTLESAFCIVTDVVPVPPLTQLGLPGFESFERMTANGITYQDLYFVRRDHAADESLHFHELVHTVQWRHLGAEKFIEAYALGYLNAGNYEGNPFEQIAYALQDDFARGDWNFQAEPQILSHLREVMENR